MIRVMDSFGVLIRVRVGMRVYIKHQIHVIIFGRAN